MTDPHLSVHTGRVHSSPDQVRSLQRQFAAALLPPQPPRRLGDVQLMPHQRDAAARLALIIHRHGGALLADEVGLGKTYTALAVAREYSQAHVLAPAGLVAMWQAALLRAGLPHVTVHSLHRASRHPLPPFAAGESMPAGSHHSRILVIVDEAHALRNATTTRYRHVAAAVCGCDVLLVSATPLHNTAHDLGALFALFRGPRRHTPSSELLATLVVRRQQRDTVQHRTVSRRRAAPPCVKTHRPLSVPQRRETLEQLLALPAPLPARDGAAAGALIRMGLLRAWCSSDAALTHALTKRLQRGTAMRDALRAGKHLTQAELRSWLIDDECPGDMQLGFAELLASHAMPPDSQGAAADVLNRHCDALRQLREQHVAHARADEVRASYLRAICQKHTGTPVVAFSQHSRTVQALFRALSDIAGVGVLTSTQARIASGKVTRPELLGWFAPRAQGRPPPPTSLRVSLLLTTDLIAEGVNLQDAGVVVHLDVPWTHALRAQRTGRVARIGSPHRVAHEYRLRASPEARRILRAELLVKRKAALSERLVGDRSARGHGVRETRARTSAVEQATRWDAKLLAWARHSGTPTRGTGSLAVKAPAAMPRVATTVSQAGVYGALALVQLPTGVRLLACVRNGKRWWLSTRADALLALANGARPSRCVRDASVNDDRTDEARLSLPMIRRVVRAWLRRECVATLVGADGRVVDRYDRALNVAQRQAMQWLQQRVSLLTTVERVRHATEVHEAQAMITQAANAGAAVALRLWMASAVAPGNVLPDWRGVPALAASTAKGMNEPPMEPRPRARVTHCLFVMPP